MATTIYDFAVKDIQGREVNLKQYEGKVLLFVNTASRCGFTPQYEGLEKLRGEYGERGFEVLAFPCNQFGHQEPGTESDIADFCTTRFHTTFPLHSKIEVNGGQAHPLYRYLKDHAPGVLGTKAIKWNFTKFLVGRDGRPIKRFAPTDRPEGLKNDIEAALAKSS